MTRYASYSSFLLCTYPGNAHILYPFFFFSLPLPTTSFIFLLQIVNNPLILPNDMNPELRNLLEGLLCKGLWNFLICLSLIPGTNIYQISSSLFIYFSYGYVILSDFENLNNFSDPKQRMTLNDVAEHCWVIGDDGPIPQYLCWCTRNIHQREESNGRSDTHLTETD